MAAKPAIVTLATAWGTRFGGINSFNAELVKSLGIVPERHYDLFCIVPTTVTAELAEEVSLRYGVILLGLGGTEEKLGPERAPEVMQLLDPAAGMYVWLGHDDKTGPIALALKTLSAGSRAVLINHMAHGAYQSMKKGTSGDAARKRAMQLELFARADLCLAVGPMLRSHLDDLLAPEKVRPPVEMLVPGLADPTEYEVELRDSPPENFVVFVAGRLHAEDDRIKQGRLALRAFGRAVRRADGGSALRRSPTLRMRGVEPAEEESLRELLMEEVGGVVNFDFQRYTEDRAVYFRDLASSSVAMMPSWHEGFGLTAWEAIASALPVVIGDQSGVYRLLLEDCSGAGLGQSVAHVRIDGWIPSTEGELHHTEQDVKRVAEALLELGKRPVVAKQQALTLRRNLLTLGLDWKAAAGTFIAAVQTHLRITLTARHAIAKPPEEPPPHAEMDVPEWVRPPVPRPWRPQLMLSTSVLLTARDEIVRFDPERQGVLDRMVKWAAGPVPLNARLVTGPSGLGKTRLALELSRQLRQRNWLTLWLPSTLPAEWAESWAAILRTRGARPALLVIDYAEARSRDVLRALGAALETLRTAENAAVVRVLLIARSEAWLSGLSLEPDCPADLAVWLAVPDAIEVLPLPPWSRDEAVRLGSYRMALEDYAAALHVPSPPNAYVPRVSEPMFGRPLYLHLAALAALEGQRPATTGALLGEQLRREWRQWRALHGEQAVGYHEWADALAYVVLSQGTTVSQLQLALGSIGIDAPGLPAALHRSYPADDRIAPLEPDLIAEALLRERLAERRGETLLDLVLGGDPETLRPAMAVVVRLAAQVRDQELAQRPAWERVLIAALVRHWPNHPTAWVTAAHGGEFGLGEALFAAWEQLDDATRVRLAASITFPGYSTNLLRLKAAVRRKQLELTTDEPSRATALNRLSIALADLGDAESRREALALAQQTVEIRRKLAEEDPGQYLPDLATALNNLGNRLSEQGDAASIREALACATETVQIRQRLVENDRGKHLPDLASALNNLGNRLSERGDAASRAEALAVTREAVRIWREVAASDPSYLPELARSLGNLGNRFANQGLRSEAVAAAREGVEIRRRLAEVEPAAYLSDLAWSLHILGNRLVDVGDAASRAESQVRTEEAVAIRRELVEKHPGAHREGLAASLNNLANAYAARGDQESHRQALALIREAVEIQRELAATAPAAYLPELAISVSNLALRLEDEGDPASRAEALALTREAVQIRRELVAEQPALYLPDLALSLNNLGNTLSWWGDAESRREALAVAREAVEIRRELAASLPAVHLPDLAQSLSNLGNRLSDMRDAASLEESLRVGREALQLYRDLVESGYSLHRGSVARVLNNLATTLRDRGGTEARREGLAYARECVGIRREILTPGSLPALSSLAVSLVTLGNALLDESDAVSRREALACTRESVAIRRQLVNAAPAAFLPELALSLSNLANQLSIEGDAASKTEALTWSREAVSIRRRLAAEEPAAHLPNLALSLSNLGNQLAAQGDAASRREALAVTREAVDIRRKLAEEMPAHRSDLAVSLHNLANRLSDQGDAASRTEAVACLREAVAIRRELVRTAPEAYLPSLCSSLNNLSNELSELGGAAARMEAQVLMRETVALRRELAIQQPAAFLFDLAGSLHNLANRLSERGDAKSRLEAVACARESVAIQRRFAEEEPEIYLAELASSLNNLGNRLSELGDIRSRVEALAHMREALQIMRERVSHNPAAHLPDLALTLHNLGNRLSEQGDAVSRAEALACFREAVAIRRTLVAEQPSAFLYRLASSLESLGLLLSEQDDVNATLRAEAVACTREALEIRRGLVASGLAVEVPALAASLHALSDRLAEAGSPEWAAEALACARESLAIRRELAAGEPMAYLPGVAASLIASSKRLFDAGSSEEALVSARQALRLYRSLNATMPFVFARNLVQAWETLERIAGAMGRDPNEELELLPELLDAI